MKITIQKGKTVISAGMTHTKKKDKTSKGQQKQISGHES
jgi:hypothetical protein